MEREAQVESYQEEGNKKFNLGIDTIYCYKLKIDNNKLLKNIDVFKKTGFKASAVNPWHSNTSLQLKSEFKFFVDELEKAFQHIGLDLILDNLWTTYQQQGEYTGIHNHTSGGVGNKKVPDWSFCYYPEDIKDTGGLIFHLNYNPTHCITEFPKAGDLYFFKSRVLHSTQPHQGHIPRVCIAGNLREKHG